MEKGPKNLTPKSRWW